MSDYLNNLNKYSEIVHQDETGIRRQVSTWYANQLKCLALDKDDDYTSTDFSGSTDSDVSYIASLSKSPIDYQSLKSSGKFESGFFEKVADIAGKLGVTLDDLIIIMAFETGGTFSPAQKNTGGYEAYGLIQFTQVAANDLGVTLAALAQMTQIQQLDYVYKFLAKWLKPGNNYSFSDIYMAILYPDAVDQPDNAVIFGRGAFRSEDSKTTKPSKYYTNRGLDKENLGYVTKKMAGDAAYKKGMSHL